MKLTQKHFLYGTREYEITDDDQLIIIHKSGGKISTHRYHFLEIKPQEERIKTQSFLSLFGVVLLGIFVLALFASMIFFTQHPDPQHTVGGMVTVSCAFIAFLIFRIRAYWKSCINVSMFYDYGHAQLFFFWYNKPDKKSFDEFISELKSRIQQAIDKRISLNQQSQIRSTETLAGEILSLKKLLEDGILSEEEFEKAKAKVLGSLEPEKKVVGFSNQES